MSDHLATSAGIDTSRWSFMNEHRSITITRISGIDIDIHYSWIVAAVLLTWSLAQGWYAELSPVILGTYSRWLMAIATLPLLFYCIVLHELAHAFTARYFGVSVPRITLFLFGGLAQYNETPRHPRAEACIAVAGPLLSLALALLFYLLNLTSHYDGPMVATLLLLMVSNLGISLFNMLPSYPMDGGRLLYAWLWYVTKNQRQAVQYAAAAGQVISIAITTIAIIGWAYWSWDPGPWLACLGIFLFQAAKTNLRSVRCQST